MKSKKMNQGALVFILLLTMVATMVPGVVSWATATGVPGLPVLEQDNWDGDGNYILKMSMWWGNNGTQWKLYENGNLIHSASLTDASPNAQTTSFTISGKANGTYNYTCQLINSFGVTTSQSVPVTVTLGGTATPTNTPTSTNGNTSTPTPTALPVIYTDGFESNNLTAGGWSNEGCTTSTSYKKSGSYSAKFNSTDRITKVIDASQYIDIKLAYNIQTRDCESTAEKFIAEWSLDGVNWTVLQTLSGNNTTWLSKNWSLPATANHQSSLSIRFRVSGYDASDNAYLDNVKVSGKEEVLNPITLAVQPFYSTAKLSWNKIADTAIAGYAVFRSQTSGQYGSVPTWKMAVNQIVTTQVYTDFDLTPGSQYFYKIVAYNSAGGLLSQYFSQEVSATMSTSNTNLGKAANLKVLVVVYSPGISNMTTYINSIKEGMNFDYRNSLGRLLLEPTFMIINSTCPENGEMSLVETDLKSRGIVEDQYDGVFVTASNGIKRLGGGLFLGNTWWAKGYAEDYDEGPANPFMKEHREGTLNAGEMHIFVHEFGHALEALFNNATPATPFLNIHSGDNFFGPEKKGLKTGYVGGDYFDGYSDAFRTYNQYDHLPTPHNDYIEYIDTDKDGLANADDRFPVDEARFSTNSTNADTDGDGRNDFAEYTAGIFQGTNPNLTDTDGDGILDQSDETPFSNWSGTMNRFTTPPVLDGMFNTAWSRLADKPAFATNPDLYASFFGGWDENNLYFMVKSNQKIRLWMSVDGSGENGSWATSGVFEGHEDFEKNFCQQDPGLSTAYGDYYGKNNALFIDPDKSKIQKKPNGKDTILEDIQGSQIYFYNPSESAPQYTLVFVVPKNLGYGAINNYWSYDLNYPLFYPEKIQGLRLVPGRTLGLQFTYAAVNSCQGHVSEFGTTEWDGQFSSMAEIFDDYKITLRDDSITSMSPPTGVRLIAARSDAKLEWDPIAPNFSYDIEVNWDGKTKVISSSKASFDFSKLTPGIEYKIRVRGKNGLLPSQWSRQISFTPVYGDSSSITWSIVYPENSGQNFANVRCPDESFIAINPSNTSGNYKVENLTGDAEYVGNMNYYSVADNQWHGISLPIKLLHLEAPQNPRFLAAGNNVLMSWDASTGYPNYPVTGYEVKIEGNGNVATFPTTETRFQYNNLVPGITYKVSIRAVNPQMTGYWNTFDLTTVQVTNNSIPLTILYPSGIGFGSQFCNVHCPDGSWKDINTGSKSGTYIISGLVSNGTYQCNINWCTTSWEGLSLNITTLP